MEEGPSHYRYRQGQVTKCKYEYSVVFNGEFTVGSTFVHVHDVSLTSTFQHYDDVKISLCSLFLLGNPITSHRAHR